VTGRLAERGRDDQLAPHGLGDAEVVGDRDVAVALGDRHAVQDGAAVMAHEQAGVRLEGQGLHGEVLSCRRRRRCVVVADAHRAGVLGSGLFVARGAAAMVLQIWEMRAVRPRAARAG
jgi:hypothetical protein